MSNFGYFFPFLFVGMWILVTFITSKMGWAALVANYQTNPEFTGQRVGIISASINNANYNNCLILKYNEEGIYLRPVILFRLFHKPILIPWNEIKEVRNKKVLFYSYKELIVGNPFVAVILLQEKVFNKIQGSIPTQIAKG